MMSSDSGCRAKKRFLSSSFIVLFIFIHAVLFGAAESHGQLNPKATEKIKSRRGFDALSSTVSTGGSVRVIVHLDTPFTPVDRPDSDAARQQMSRIGAAQDVLLSRLAGLKVKGIHKYRYIPHIVMEVDENALNALVQSGDVLDISEDVPVPPALDLSVPRIGAPILWNDFGYTGAGVTAAVLDTGVDKTHPFLSSAVVSEACYSSNNATDSASTICPGGVTDSTAVNSAMPYGGTCPDGMCDHGTHVSGIIAGRRNVAGSPGPGVAPEAGIIAIQVFSLFNSISQCGASLPCIGAYPSDILKGLERVYNLASSYAISSVNLSLAGNKYSDQAACDGSDSATKSIIDSLRAIGIATVIAAGNDGWCGYMSWPGCISSAVAVGATTDSDVRSGYSNSSSMVDLMAPGSAIMSSVPGGGYASWNGTSMATPHVTGAWALMKDASPNATVPQVLSAFQSTGVPINSCTTKQRINVSEALSELRGTPIVRASAPTGIGQAGATLNGIANANNTTSTISFQYGTTTSYGTSVTATPSVTGSSDTPILANISGLAPNTLYHYRVVSSTYIGYLLWKYAYSDDITFVTSGSCGSIQSGGLEGYPPLPGWTDISSKCGTPLCDAMSDPEGCPPHSGYGAALFGCFTLPEIASLTQSVTIPSGSSPNLTFYLLNSHASGNGTDSFSVQMDGREIFTVIEGDADYTGVYRQAALDLSPYADGNAHTLTFYSALSGLSYFMLDDIGMTCSKGTLPDVETGPASVVNSVLQMTGTVDAFGVNANVWFDYGTATFYEYSQSGNPSAVGLNGAYSVIGAGTSAEPGNTYHYRIVAQNSAGISYGRDMTFWLPCPSAMAKIGEIGFSTLQQAINTAIDGTTVLADAAVFDENPVTFDKNGQHITLEAGYDCSFGSIAAFTSIQGTLIIKRGTITLDNILLL